MKKINKNRVFTCAAISLMMVTSSANALSLNKVKAVVKTKVACEFKEEILPESCEEADEIFEQIKSSQRVREIYQYYIDEKVQMEMEFSGHCGGCRT